jgi:hypothetical protein
VVVAEILGEGHEIGCANRIDGIENLAIPFQKIAVHAMHEFGLVIESKEVGLDAEERAGVPEETHERDPDDGVAGALERGPLRETSNIDDLGGIGIDCWANAFIVVGGGDGLGSGVFPRLSQF